MLCLLSRLSQCTMYAWSIHEIHQNTIEQLLFLHYIVRYMTFTAYITTDMLLSISVLEFHLKLVVYFSTKGNIFTVNQYHICSARNKNQKLVGRFLKIGYLIDYWLLSHWKCTGNLADQNGFWSTKWWNWSENGQWPTVISSTVFDTIMTIMILKNYHNNDNMYSAITGVITCFVYHTALDYYNENHCIMMK